MNKRLLGVALLLPTTIAGILGYWNMVAKLAQTPEVKPSTSFERPVELLFHQKQPSSGTGTVGIVHLAPLLHAHPLAQQLATDDRQLYTLRILNAEDQHVDSHADILRAQTRLQNELRRVGSEVQQRMQRRANELTQEEHREMRAVLAAAATQEKDHVQAAETITHADAVMTAHSVQEDHHFMTSITAEERMVLQSAERGLDTQAKATLEAKAAQIAQEETELATQLAQHNSDERVRLRLRQANLALSDAEQKTIKDRLNELDQSEALVLSTKRLADHTTLLQLADELRSHRASKAALAAQNAQNAGYGALAAAHQAPSPPPPAPLMTATPAPIDPALRKRLMSLREKYQDRFNNEEAQSLQAFRKVQARLQAQFTSLGQADATQRNEASAELERLGTQRGQLYAAMISDIQHALSHIAAQRGIQLVMVDPLAVAPGVVDLTDEVAKNLAHEAR